MFELINNNNVKVTKFFLASKEETGFHLHKYNYVIIPITSGELTIIDKNKVKTKSIIKKGEPYYKDLGVEHNVINETNSDIIFIEVEIKKK